MKYIILLAVIVSCAFSYGLRPSFSVNASWVYDKPEGYDGLHFLSLGIGTVVPYSSYIGLNAGIFWFDICLSDEGIILGASSRIGLIEMIPTKNVSPYFTQSIILDHASSGGYSLTQFGFGFGFGIEFLSSSYVSPCIGGGVAYYIIGADGSSADEFGITAGIKVRFSWSK